MGEASNTIIKSWFPSIFQIAGISIKGKLSLAKLNRHFKFKTAQWIFRVLITCASFSPWIRYKLLINIQSLSVLKGHMLLCPQPCPNHSISIVQNSTIQHGVSRFNMANVGDDAQMPTTTNIERQSGLRKMVSVGDPISQKNATSELFTWQLH